MKRQHTLGSDPIEDVYHAKMNQLAQLLDHMFNGDEVRTTGFVLLVFPLGEHETGEHRCNYISNADRSDIITLMKESLAYFEGQSDTPKGTA
jgi:hypothetical protein